MEPSTSFPGAPKRAIPWLLAPFAALLQAACGGAGAGCEELCAIEADCSSDSGAIPVDVEDCTAACEEQADDDEAYAEAVETRADCLESERDEPYFCENLPFLCRPSD